MERHRPDPAARRRRRPRSTASGRSTPPLGGNSSRYSLSLDWQQPLFGGRLVASAYAIRYDLDLFSNFTYWLDNPDQGDQFEQADDRRIYGTTGSWAWTGELGGFANRVTAGWDLRQDRIGNVGLYSTAGRERVSTTRQDRVKESSAALYVEAETRWDEKFRTLAGLRYDRYRFDVASSLPENSGNGSAGLASPEALGDLRAVGDSPSSSPTTAVASTATTRAASPPRVDPGSGETGRSGDAAGAHQGRRSSGARTEILPDVQSSLALWQLDIDSELLFVGDAGTTEPSRPSRRQGVEWNTRWRPISWLLLDLDVAWTKARFTDDDPAGKRIPGAIETAVSAGATIQQLGPWSASVFLRYFGARPLIEDNSVRSTSSTIVNAQVGYRVTRDLLVGLEAFNLFDAEVDDIAYYYASRLPGEPPGGVNDVHFHPAESRSFRATLRYSF